MKSYWPQPDENINAVVIVAHPDDETIFCGGTILTFPFWKWNIICVTMQLNTPRPQEFNNAMEMYKKYGVNINSYLTLNKRDDGQDLSPEEIKDWTSSIERTNLSSDIFLTHNRLGEYGHNHHMNLNNIVHKLFLNVWDFVYPGDEKISPQPTKSILHKIPLSNEILSRKKTIFETCYITQSPGLWSDWRSMMEYEFLSGPEIFTSD